MPDVLVFPDLNEDTPGQIQPRIVSFGSTVYAFAVSAAPLAEAFVYGKSVDGGKTFGTPVTIATAGINVVGGAIWFERWTEGDTGTLILIGYVRNNSAVAGDPLDGAFYRSLDTRDDTLSAEFQVAQADTNNVAIQWPCSICKLPGGNLLMTWAAVPTAAELSRSTDGGKTWTLRATADFQPWGIDSAAGDTDLCIVRPANTADPNDANCFFWSQDPPNDVLLKEYDDSANTITVTVIQLAVLTSFDAFLEAVPNHANGHTILAYRDASKSATSTCKVWDINGGGSIVAMPEGWAAVDDRQGIGLCINQQNGDIYLAWNDEVLPVFTTSTVFHQRLAAGAGAWDAPIQNSTTDRRYNDTILPLSIDNLGGIVLSISVVRGVEEHYCNPGNSVHIPATLSPKPLIPTAGSFGRLLGGGAGGFMTYITPDGREYPLHTPHEFGRWVISFSGFGTPPIQYITQRGPFQHGATVVDFFLRPRVLQLLVRQNFISRLEWWRGRAALLNEIRPNRQATATAALPGELRLVETDGTTRSLNVFITEGPRFEPRIRSQWDEHSFMEMLRFTAYDPVAFDPTQVVVTFALTLDLQLVFPITFPIQFGSGVIDDTQNVAYPGTWEEFPVITVVGPIENFRLDNVTTGEKIEFGANIGPGRTVTIDLRLGFKTVVDDLEANLIGIVTSDSDLATWHLAPDPEAPLGVNALRLRGNNPTGTTSVTLRYFDRYFGF